MTSKEQVQRVAALRAKYGDDAVNRYLISLVTLKSITADPGHQIAELERLLLKS